MLLAPKGEQPEGGAPGLQGHFYCFRLGGGYHRGAELRLFVPDLGLKVCLEVSG